MAELPTGSVTFLFTDIEGSTRLWEEHPEAMREALARHDALLSAGIEEHGGAVVKSHGEGDSLFAVFAQATAAVAAAAALQQALLAEPWPVGTPLRVRMALHTDAAQLRDGDYYGAAVNRCARLRGVAHGGQVLLSLPTEALVRAALPEGASLRDPGLHRLPDLSQPERIFQLVHPNLPADFPPLVSLDTLPNNLPRQLTSFIGRENAMAEVKELLGGTALLTLTGSGGCGKTRLALRVAADLLREYSHGVWLVELAALADPALVPQRVASVLGVREEPGRPLTATLTDYVRPKSLLLVLDNCEHLLAACAQLAEGLLRSCPQLRILASSREGLGIAGERAYPVPSLSVPGVQAFRRSGVEGEATSESERLDTRTPERLLEYEAVRLFVERAVFAQPSFAVSDQNAAAVAQVCQRLDGIPLAIELAAARVKALSVDKISERLNDMFRLLTGGSRTALPRQQTLRARIDWSYDLLSEPERALLRRLSVFAGGWTLEAAETVCAGDGMEEWEVLDALTALVQKSLVVYEEDEQGRGRYRLRETVRQYSRDRLAAGTHEVGGGEGEAVRDRHGACFLQMAEAARAAAGAGKGAEAFERLEPEHDNLRAALAWALKAVDSGQWSGVSPAGSEATVSPPSPELATNHRPLTSALRLAGALGEFWFERGYWNEGRQWLESALAAVPDAQPTAERARALAAAGRLPHLQAGAPAARNRLEESIALYRVLGDTRGLVEALTYLAEEFLSWGGASALSHPWWRGWRWPEPWATRASSRWRSASSGS